MKWKDFLSKYGDEPIIESNSIPTGGKNIRNLQNRLNQWVQQGKLIQLRRGLYVVDEPFQKNKPTPECIANRLKYPSYISMNYALFYYDLIPEGVYTITSVTTRRGQVFQNPFGQFRYRHIKIEYFWGFQLLKQDSRHISIAYPEKALLDYLYFMAGTINPDRINELRLQNLEQLSPKRLSEFLKRFDRPKLYHIAKMKPLVSILE